MRFSLDLPQPVYPLFWGLLFLEATFGAYFAIWPLWIERLGAPITVVGLMLGSAGIVRLFTMYPSAAIADRFGYRRTMVVARVFAVAGLLVAAVATHWTQLIFMVIGAAIGEMVFPLMQALVATEAGEQRMRAFTLVFNVGPSTALVLSPLLSGLLVAIFDIRAAFVLGAVFTLISIYFLLQVREPEDIEEAREDSPAGYLDVFRHPGIRMIATLLFATIFVLAIGISFIPTFLEDVRGLKTSTIATMGALPAMGSAAWGLLVARSSKLQAKPFVTASVTIATTAIAFLLIRSTAIFAVIIIAFFMRGGLFSTWAMLAGVMGDMAPSRLRSRAFASLEMVGGIAFSLGPILAGFLYATRNTLSFEVAALFSFLLVPVYILIQRRVDRENVAEPQSTELEVEAPT